MESTLSLEKKKGKKNKLIEREREKNNENTNTRKKNGHSQKNEKNTKKIGKSKEKDHPKHKPKNSTRRVIGEEEEEEEEKPLKKKKRKIIFHFHDLSVKKLKQSIENESKENILSLIYLRGYTFVIRSKWVVVYHLSLAVVQVKHECYLDRPSLHLAIISCFAAD
ncbi:hypothetical protein RFI_20100 [Reticulomyxa filosa]|uniref:Uncharacterized protein n=1 Tax=Reticulomyxa filosa TaxID=46433 RepID=X6MVV1_RETFI|nr:hypothetical protein RFI_20100 [Reticulomyxa filosa]|eukprot:ETO17230.1 hypothetical protein RFI_20100 [Reticulomyxa filosa]